MPCEPSPKSDRVAAAPCGCGYISTSATMSVTHRSRGWLCEGGRIFTRHLPCCAATCIAAAEEQMSPEAPGALPKRKEERRRKKVKEGKEEYVRHVWITYRAKHHWRRSSPAFLGVCHYWLRSSLRTTLCLLLLFHSSSSSIAKTMGAQLPSVLSWL